VACTSTGATVMLGARRPPWLGASLFETIAKVTYARAPSCAGDCDDLCRWIIEQPEG
jgi:hypothetical protein